MDKFVETTNTLAETLRALNRESEIRTAESRVKQAQAVDAKTAFLNLLKRPNVRDVFTRLADK